MDFSRPAVYPPIAHFYIVKLGILRVYIFFFFTLKHRLWVLVRIEYPQIIFSKRKISFFFQMFLYSQTSLYVAWACFRNGNLDLVMSTPPKVKLCLKSKNDLMLCKKILFI